MNFVVFDTSEKNIRNAANEHQLNDLQDLERKYTDLISEGYITNQNQLKSKLRNEYKKRHIPLLKFQ